MSEEEKHKRFWDSLEALRKAYDEAEAYYDKLAEECDPDTKLAVTRWAMRNIVDHARYGGSYRYLIYDRLGFDEAAYGALLNDGMTISNEFNLSDKKVLKDLFKTILQDQEGDLDLIKMQVETFKSHFNICDERGCCEETTCGWPTQSGEYRRTCGEHYQREK